MISRLPRQRARPPIRADLFRSRALAAAAYVGARRGKRNAARGRSAELARALALVALLGLGILVAGQLGAAAASAVDQVAGQIQHLIPNPVVERSARPSADSGTPNAAPILDAFERYTRDSRLVVSGKVPSFALGSQPPAIEILVNGSLAASPAVGADGRFSATVALADGSNTIVVAAVRNGARSESSARTVTLDTIPPPLTFTKPADGDSVDGPRVAIQGRTEAGATVTVNGHPVNVTADGSFADTLQAATGPLTVDVVARDQAGNETKKTLKLTVRPAGPFAVQVSLGSALVRPGTPVSVDVLVTDAAQQPAANAAVSVSIGLVTVASGTTDAGGRYRTVIVAPATEGLVQIVVNVTGTSASGRGAATLEVAR